MEKISLWSLRWACICKESKANGRKILTQDALLLLSPETHHTSIYIYIYIAVIY